MTAPRRHDENLRIELINVTAARLARGGPSSVSLREIAHECDTSTTAIYALFGGKNELIAEVIKAALKELGDALFTVSPEENPIDGLTHIACAYHDWAMKNSAMFNVMFNQIRQPLTIDSKEISLAEEDSDPTYGRIGAALHNLGAPNERIERLITLASDFIKAAAAEKSSQGELDDIRSLLIFQRLWAAAHGLVHLELQGFLQIGDFERHMNPLVKSTFASLEFLPNDPQ